MAEATQSTLLQRIRDPSDHSAWREFDRIYRPLMVGYAVARGVQPSDAEDIAQQAAECVLRSIHSYQDGGKGSFRAWVRRIVERRLQDHFRTRREIQATSTVLEAQPSDDPSLTALWEAQWWRVLLRHCVLRVRDEVAVKTFEAFREHALEGKAADAVAASLGMNISQVYVAKHRILRRIRELMALLSDGERVEVA